jgi:hypothetical protein
MEDALLDFYSSFAPQTLIGDLYDETMLTSLTLAVLFFTGLAAGLFYYGINSIRFGQFRHWIITMLVAGCITFVLVYGACTAQGNEGILRNNSNPNLGYRFDQGADVFLLYSVEMLFMACLFFFLWSLALKWGSKNCRMTPF